MLTTKDGLPSDHVVALLETETRRHSERSGSARAAADWPRWWTATWCGPGTAARAWRADDALTLAEVRLGAGRRELWVGTRSGVMRRDLDAPSPGWSRLAAGMTPSGPAGTVVSIGQDRAGRVYLGTQRGVVRLTPVDRPTRAPTT